MNYELWAGAVRAPGPPMIEDIFWWSAQLPGRHRRLRRAAAANVRVQQRGWSVGWP